MVGLAQFWHAAVVAHEEGTARFLVIGVGGFPHHILGAEALVVVNENAGNVDAVGARHTVFAVVTRNGVVAHYLLRDILVEETHFCLGERFKWAESAKVVAQMLHIGHARKHTQHIFTRAGIAKRPRCHRVVGVAAFELRHQFIGQIAQASTQQRFHHKRHQPTLSHLAIQVLGIRVIVVDFLGVLPVEVVEFDKHKVKFHLSLVVQTERMVEHRHIAMIGETQVANHAFLLLLVEEVHHAIVHESLLKQPHRIEPFLGTVTADVMPQIVVEIGGLQFLERLFKHRNRRLARIVVVVAHLRGYEILLAVVAREGCAESLFAQSLAVEGRGVEQIEPMLQSVVHLLVHHILVDFALAVLAFADVVVFGRQSHHAIAQERHLVARGGADAVGHLADGRLLLTHLLAIFGAAHDSRNSHGGCADAQSLEE